MANDTQIFIGILSIFIITGLFLPDINSAYGEKRTSTQYEAFANNMTDYGEEDTGTSITGRALSLLSVFFWTFGALPTWLDAVFLIFRASLIIIGYRLLRSGAG